MLRTTTIARRVALATACGVAILTAGACASTVAQSAAGEVILPSASDIGSMRFTDANIAAVGSSANQDEIQTSRIALDRSRNDAVRAFAQMMIDQHTGVESQMQQLLSRKGMTPMDNQLSTRMKANLAVTLPALQARSGADFDMNYMQHQVDAHTLTLNALDSALIPQAQDAELRMMLTNTVRPAVAMHLERARALHDSLMRGM